MNRLLDASVGWGGGPVQPTTYVPSGYRIFAIPESPANDPATAQTPVAWPLSTRLAAFGTLALPDRGIAGLRQGVALRADAVTLGPILARATVATGFTSGGTTWTLNVRPLLPDELGS